MKIKFSLILLMLFLVSTVSFGQLFHKGSMFINAGAGAGSPYVGGGLTPNVPPISLSLEYGVTKKLGVGVFAGYTTSGTSMVFPSEDDQGNIVAATMNLTTTYLVFGGRVMYHFFTTDKFDFYGGAMLGYRTATADLEIDPPSASQGAPPVAADVSALEIGAFAGGRYFFTKHLGVFVEAGYSMAYITGGLSVGF